MTGLDVTRHVLLLCPGTHPPGNPISERLQGVNTVGTQLSFTDRHGLANSSACTSSAQNITVFSVGEPRNRGAGSEPERSRLHSTRPSLSLRSQPHQREPPCAHQNTAEANRTLHVKTKCMLQSPSSLCPRQSCVSRAL